MKRSMFAPQFLTLLPCLSMCWLPLDLWVHRPSDLIKNGSSMAWNLGTIREMSCLMLKLLLAQTPQRSIREVNVIIEGDPWISQDANKLYLHQIYYQDSIGRIVVWEEAQEAQIHYMPIIYPCSLCFEVHQRGARPWANADEIVAGTTSSDV